MKLHKWILLTGGLAMGSVLGYGYWYYIGCLSGTCPITASPVNSTLYGAVLGILIANLFLPTSHDPAKGK